MDNLCCTLVSGRSRRTYRNKPNVEAAKRSSVPDMLSGERARMGDVWLTKMRPPQNPRLLMEIRKPKTDYIIYYEL